jgi:hypothetical protein
MARRITRGDAEAVLNAAGTGGRVILRNGRAPAFSRFVMIRPVRSAGPRSSEHGFCAGQGGAGPSTTIRTYVS